MGQFEIAAMELAIDDHVVGDTRLVSDWFDHHQIVTDVAAEGRGRGQRHPQTTSLEKGRKKAVHRVFPNATFMRWQGLRRNI